MNRTNPHDLLWTEKYRPDSLERLALSDENEKLARSFLEEGEFPHLLLAGQAGTGKTTLARILIEGVDAQDLSLNASDERGIDTIRNKVGSFVRGRLGARWNVVFLDEADNLTRDAQQALRAMMEKHSGNARFILTANYPHRIIDPIRSRCTALEMSEVPAKRRFKILAHILKSEGVKVPSKKVVVSYARKYRDLRRMISSAQRSVQTHEELRPASEALVSGEKIFEACRRNDWSYIKKVSGKTGFDHRAALEDLFSAIPDGFRRAATWRAVVGEAVDDSNRVPDPVVHFLATCATLIADVHE